MVSDADMPAKSVVIEALLLAFSNSRIRELASTEALRDVLDIEYREIIESGSFDLQQVWELLEEQPGFAAELAIPPLCLFKSWEERLGLAIDLPDGLADKSDKDLLLEASQCPVGPKELQAVLDKGKHQRKSPKVHIQELRSDSDPEPPGQRPMVLVGAIVVALASFLFAAYYLKQGCAGPAWEDMSAAEFAGELPLRNARRIGAEVGAELSDPAWLGIDDDVRSGQLEAALLRLARKNISILFITDEDGQVRATAQFFGEPRRIRVRFH